MSSGKFRMLFFVFDKMADQSETYHTLKNDEEERETNRFLGSQAIKYSVFYLILIAAVVGLVIGSYSFLEASGIWQAILMIVIAVVCLPYALIFLLLSLNCAIKQMRLNKQRIGLISLLLTLFIFVASIAALIVGILLI